MADKTILNNRYQLDEILGSGGMAVVYRAKDITLERTVAIKILRKDYSSNTEFRERFHQEAKASANLAHPNIVTIHDFGLDSQNRLFIVMEYVIGTDLKSLMRSRGRYTINEAISLMVQACAGVGYAHRAGLAHCDIKPQNILITPDFRLKVVDFGIARALESIHPDEKLEVVWGSPQYFSPEQAAGKAPSPASDVYSLGVIMYEMLTGQLPFNASSSAELTRMHRQDMPISPRTLNSDIPPALEQIMLKVLAKEPSSRYRTADQLGRILISFRDQYLTNAASLITPPIQTAKTQQISQSLSPSSTQMPVDQLTQSKNPLDIDWITIGLGFLVLIAVGGLIPFSLWVYFVLNPPIP
jgi:serine/threonine-protein kinase